MRPITLRRKRIMIIAVATVVVLLVAVVVVVVTIGGIGPRGNILSRDSKGLLATGARQYPLGATAAAVTGYYSERRGASGLERAGEEVLGSGNAVQTAVDLRVQQAAYDAMTKANYTGAVVALKPQTGEILAMVSTPSYDPNLLSSHNFGEQDKAWQQLTDPKNTAKPMVNRAIEQTYPPGSIFKLVVAAAALEDGMTADTRLPSVASIQLPGTRTELENVARRPCEPVGQPTVSLENALQFSCNTAFARLADQLGKEKVQDQAKKFGIGQADLRIPMEVAASGVGALPDRAALFQAGIGQRDVRFTPLQSAMVAAGIANNGVVMRPQLVHSGSDELGRAMSSSNAAELRDIMKESEESTPGLGKVRGLVVASKTGAAEHGADPKTPPHAWYVAFAPADNPQIAVAVLVESGGDRKFPGTGGSAAAPIGRATINAAVVR